MDKKRSAEATMLWNEYKLQLNKLKKRYLQPLEEYLYDLESEIGEEDPAGV